MSMREYNPWGEMLSLREAMNRLLEDSYVTSPGAARGAVGAMAMPLDVYETRDALIARTSMPGIKPEDIEITVTGDTLTIRGEIRDQPPGEEARYHHREHRYGTFARSVTLPVEVQSDKVEATFEHGVLTLTMPKAERMRPKQIKITTRGGAAQIGTQGGVASSAPTIEGQTAGSTPTSGGASAAAGGMQSGTAAGPSDETAAAPSGASTAAPKRPRKKSTK